VSRFLLVRLGALGDIVHAIPVAAALRRAFPKARIDWLVSAKHREILDLVPVLDRRLAIKDRPATRRGPAGTDARADGSAEARADPGIPMLAAVRELRKAHYDAVIDMQGLIKSALVARSVGADRVIGFSRKYLREAVAQLFYTDVHDPGGDGIYAPSEKRHIVDINLGLLRSLGVTAGIPEFPIDAVSSAVADEVCDQTGGRYALLNSGAAWPNKRWPPPRLAELASLLSGRHHLKSVVLWGPGERELADEVVASSGGAALLSPPTSIADIVALARGAAVMVSGDTGPTHIAAAVGTPIVGIYGPTRPERNGPWLAEDITVSRASMCGCHHLRRCRRERMCLLDVGVHEVFAAVETRLAAGRQRV
jgi:heptosyltransferase-1